MTKDQIPTGGRPVSRLIIGSWSLVIDWVLGLGIWSLAALVVGCSASKPATPQAVAQQQWNDTRAGVLAVLAQDQYRNGSFEKCEATLAEALRLSPQNAELHLLAARLAIEQGNLEVAQLRLDHARALAPANPQVDYLTGVILQRWQRPAAALAAYGAAAAKDPGEVSYAMAEGEMLVALGKPAAALELLSGQAAVFDHSAALRDAIGELLVRQHRFGEAVDALRQATLLAGDDEVIREHFGLALFYAGQHAEAADVIGRLVRDDAHAKRADLFAALGESRRQLGQLPAALEALTTATDLAPDAVAYWLAAGRVAIELDDLPTSDRIARRAVAIDAGNGEAQCLLGYVRLKQGKPEPALAAFRAASTLDPRDVTDLCMGGLALEKLGRPAEAKAMFDRARQIDPADALAAKCVADAGE